MRLLIFTSLIISTLLTTLPSHAGIELIDIEGASNFIGIGTQKEEGDSPTIFGGTAGTACTGTSDEVTCSNCTSTSFESACNDKRIYSTLKLKIKFKSDSTSGTAAFGDSDGNAVSGLTPASGSTGSLSQGSTHTLIATWSNVCTGVLSIGADCLSDEEGTLSVGVDENGDGVLDDDDDDRTTISIVVKNSIDDTAKHCDDTSIASDHGVCGFEVFPGDQKVFIKVLNAPDGFPTASTPDFEKIRVYIGEGGTFSDISHSNTFLESEIKTDDDGTLSADPDAVESLTNGTQYFFRVATVDQAQNVGFHTPITRSDTSTAFHEESIHSATPSEVRALLSETVQCFIATAAFGSPFQKHVKTLRHFRDEFLNTNIIGRWLVQTYYKLSPPLAQWISKRPWARSLTRVLLFPAVLLAQSTLKWGFLPLFAILFLGFATFAALLFRNRLQKVAVKNKR